MNDKRNIRCKIAGQKKIENQWHTLCKEYLTYQNRKDGQFLVTRELTAV